jgi:hypothetical protein
LKRGAILGSPSGATRRRELTDGFNRTRLQTRPHFFVAFRLHYDIIEIAIENADSKRKEQYEL